MTDLPDQLARSSAQFAQTALQALPNGDYALFALHGGTVLEHLAKAVLATRHPALIAANDFDSVLLAPALRVGRRSWMVAAVASRPPTSVVPT